MPTMYEVHTRQSGRKMISNGGPCDGLLERTKHKWTKITRRPIGLKRAIALADAQPTKAVVLVWDSSEKVHDNNKPATVPDGWWHCEAQTVFDPKRPSAEPSVDFDRIVDEYRND